jgi:hypothetical protein
MPYHGLPAKHHYDGANNWTQAYRFNIADPINWTSSMLFTIEHGGYPYFDSGYYSVVAYSYQQRAPATYLAAEITTENETNHFRSCNGISSTNTAKFITPNAEVAAQEITFSGYSNVLQSVFSVSIPPDNNGVILQGLSDFTGGTNSATVWVGGTLAGRWSQVDLSYTNSTFGWGMNEVVLPASLTKGLSRLDVQINYSAPATEYRFRILPLAQFVASDSFFQAWVNGFSELGCFTNLTDDFDCDRLNNLAEYAVGGDPSDAGDTGFFFYPSLKNDGGVDYFEYVYARRKDDDERGLAYSLEQTDSLIGESWSTNGVQAVGAGELNAEFDSVTNQVPSAEETFLRLRVQFH